MGGALLKLPTASCNRINEQVHIAILLQLKLEINASHVGWKILSKKAFSSRI
jgi:hypothetical protein